MRNELCESYHTHSHTHSVILEDSGGISNINVKYFGQSPVWPAGQCFLLCTLHSLSLSWVYITEALYKSIHVSLCLHYNDTLYIYWAREFLSYNLFNSRTCEGVQRSRRTVGLKKEHADRDHIHGDTNKKQLFVLWWWGSGANVSDPDATENYHMESGLCRQSNYRLFSHARGRAQGTGFGQSVWHFGRKYVKTCSMDWHAILCRESNLMTVIPWTFL